MIKKRDVGKEKAEKMMPPGDIPLPQKVEGAKTPEEKKPTTVKEILQMVIDRIILGETKRAGGEQDNWWNKALYRTTHIIQTQLDVVESTEKVDSDLVGHPVNLLGMAVITIEAERIGKPQSAGEAKFNSALDRSIAIVNNVIREVKTSEAEQYKAEQAKKKE